MAAVVVPHAARNVVQRWIDDNRLLAAALGVSVAMHAMALTVRFVGPDAMRIEARDPQLEVVIVNARSDKAPTHAEVLAQAALEGGGDKAQGRATTPLPSVNIEHPGDSLAEARRRVEALDAEQKKLLAALKAQKALPEPPVDRKAQTEPARPDGADLVESSRALANKFAIVEARIEDEYKRPKKYFYGTGARDYVAALYIDNFRAKVERWGTLNFPEAARGKFYGAVQFTVVLDKDGQVYGIEITKSSGAKLLDQAALDIVRRAGPYGRFTPQMTQEMDLLSITRTLVFSNDTIEARAK